MNLVADTAGLRVGVLTSVLERVCAVEKLTVANAQR